MTHGGNVWQGREPGDWLDFSANLRPEGPPDWVKKTLNQAMSRVRFYPDPGLTEAKRGLAAYLRLPPERVLPTPGGEAAIDLTLSIGSGPVYFEAPTFSSYAQRAAAHHRPLANRPEGSTLVLCNPNNPTGAAVSRQEALALHSRQAASGGELIVDEAFIDFCPERSVRESLCPTLTAVGSLTKVLSIPGVRLGYAAGDPEKIAALRKKALTWPLGAFAAAVAAELPLHAAEIKKDAALNAQRRAAFAASLTALGFFPHPSQANFILCDFSVDMTDTVSALKEKGILVRTCQSFGLGSNYLRLAVKTEEENQRLIREIKQCLKR